MKRREETCYWHPICIQIVLVFLGCACAVVSGLTSHAEAERGTNGSGLPSSQIEAVSPNAQDVNNPKNTISEKNNISLREDVHYSAQSRNVSLQQNIENLHHEALSLLNKVLNGESSKNYTSNTNSDKPNKMQENSLIKQIRILGKSPLPPFKTRQNSSSRLDNKITRITARTHFNETYENNDSIGKLREDKIRHKPFVINRTELTGANFLQSIFNDRIWKNKKLMGTSRNLSIGILFGNNKTRKAINHHHSGNNSDKDISRQNTNRTTNERLVKISNTSSSLFPSSKFVKIPHQNTSSNAIISDKKSKEIHSSTTARHEFLGNRSIAGNLNNTENLQSAKNRSWTKSNSDDITSNWKHLSVKAKKDGSDISSSLGNLMITQDIVMQLGQKKDKRPSVETRPTCLTGDIQHNYTMSSGLGAGYYAEEEKAKTMEDCIYHCCAKEKCDVAFMIKENCFLIQCYQKSTCRSRKAHSSGFYPRLAYISRQDQNSHYDNLPENKQRAQSKTEVKDHCEHHVPIENMTFQSGLDAGFFTPHGEVKTFKECANHCCQQKNCDVVFMVNNLCYSVHCKNKTTCRPVEGNNPKTNISLAFLSRGNRSPLIDASYFKIQQQKHRIAAIEQKDRKVPSSCSAKNVSPVFRNVKLRDGIKAGNFTDKGLVSNYRQCVNYCCQDKLCNVALTIKNNCFLVACWTYRGCSMYPALRPRFDPHIVYINWEEPARKVFEKGNILYKTLGCWREDGNLERVVSLEGTDPVLADSYKMRENTVEKCAAAAMKRNFKVFALHNGGECRSGFVGEQAYKKKGTSNGCFNGVGSHMSNHVYSLRENGTFDDLGCWSAIQNEGFVTLESTDGRIMGNYKDRFDAFLKCAEAAMEQHYTLFALRDGGQCFGGFKATTEYKKHGVSKHCENGLGSPSSKSVYQIIGSTTFQLGETDESPSLLHTAKDHKWNLHTNNPKHPILFSIAPDDKKKDSGKMKLEMKNRLHQPWRKPANISYEASPIENNIFVHGMKAGSFISQGAMRNMEECIDHCGKQLNCSAAFMLQKYCFSVKCFSKASCETRRAASSMFNPRVSFITHFPSSKKNNTGENFSKQCRVGKIYQNVTLFGGINAGHFTDLGQTNNMKECIGHCCRRKRCDVAFMLENDCYGVTCKTKQLCGTKPAKYVEKYKPQIAYLEPPQEHDSGKSLSSCWNGEVLINHTLTGGIDAGVFYANGNTETMNTCMKYCCQQNDCDLAFLIDQGCYTVRCKDKEQCRPRRARETRYLPQIAYKHGATFFHPDGSKKNRSNIVNNNTRFSTNKPGETIDKESSKDRLDHGKTKPVIKLPHLPHSCEVGPIHYNVTLKMGMHSGAFKKLGRTKQMEDCIEMGCQEKDSDAAFMLGQLCYSVKCYNEDLCQTRPAFISNINILNINPAVAFLNTATKEHTDYSRSETERTCVGTTITRNVTLLGGADAGNFIDNGERRTIEECVSACCNTPYCDVAFMNGKRCYSVECKNETLCQAVTAEAFSKSTAVAYVARYSEPDVIQFQDLELSSATQCPFENIKKLEIHKNKTLIGGFESGNYTFLGRTRDMSSCVQKCCGLSKCDVAYSIDGNCYGIECFSADLCTIDDRAPESTSTEISIIKNLRENESRFNSKYTLPVVSGFVAVVIVIGWVYWLRSTKILTRSEKR